jgi:hypothetical protein
VAHLFRHGGTRELEQDFEQWGAPPAEYLEAIEAAETYELWPENVEPLGLFMQLQTQWRMGPAGPSGLDYAGVRAAFSMMRVRLTPALFGDVQAMERAALAIMAEARDGT